MHRWLPEGRRMRLRGYYPLGGRYQIDSTCLILQMFDDMRGKVAIGHSILIK